MGGSRRKGRALTTSRTGDGTALRAGISQVFELFSGIGGNRVAFQRAASELSVGSPRWRAMEVDQTCCEVYARQFQAGYVQGARASEQWNYAVPMDQNEARYVQGVRASEQWNYAVPMDQNEVWRCSIDRLPNEAFDGADLWIMSPPCQPFTRTGKKLDLDDNRSAALIRLLEALPKLKKPPNAIFMENVPEFVGSRSHTLLREVLNE